MKKFRDLAIFLFFSLSAFIIAVGAMYNYYLSPVSHDNDKKEIEIKNGKDVNKISLMLYDKGLIRNPKVFGLYLKIHDIKKIKEGLYKLSPSMSSKEIAHYLSIGNQK